MKIVVVNPSKVIWKRLLQARCVEFGGWCFDIHFFFWFW
jgi:hypothetical protein